MLVSIKVCGLSTRCWNLAAWICFSCKIASEANNDVGTQPESQLIPKMLNGVEVKALCRPVKFFHSNWEFLYGAGFVHVVILTLKQERAKQYTVVNVILSIKISLHLN